MKKIRVVFEKVPLTDEIEVIIRASENDEQAAALAERISQKPPDELTGTDSNGNICVIFYCVWKGPA